MLQGVIIPPRAHTGRGRGGLSQDWRPTTTAGFQGETKRGAAFKPPGAGAAVPGSQQSMRRSSPCPSNPRSRDPGTAAWFSRWQAGAVCATASTAAFSTSARRKTLGGGGLSSSTASTAADPVVECRRGVRCRWEETAVEASAPHRPLLLVASAAATTTPPPAPPAAARCRRRRRGGRRWVFWKCSHRAAAAFAFACCAFSNPPSAAAGLRAKFRRVLQLPSSSSSLRF